MLTKVTANLKAGGRAGWSWLDSGHLAENAATEPAGPAAPAAKGLSRGRDPAGPEFGDWKQGRWGGVSDSGGPWL